MVVTSWVAEVSPSPPNTSSPLIKRMTTMIFDDLFEHIGGGGRFQITLFFALGMLCICSMEILYTNFTAADMEHWCKVKELSDFPLHLQKYITIPAEDGTNKLATDAYHNCEMFDLNFSIYSRAELLSWNRSLRITNETSTKTCTLGWIYNRDEFVRTIISEFGLVCSDAWRVPLVSTIYVAGIMVGSATCGPLSDRFGRKRTLLAYLALKTGAGFFTAFAPSYGSMVAAWFLTAVGSMGANLASFVLAMEMVGPRYRTQAGVGFMIAYSLGCMTIPGIAYVIRDFRKQLIVMASPSVIFLVAFQWMLVESPRWLLLKGRVKEAEKIIKMIADTNKKTLPSWLDLNHVKTDEPNTRKGTLIDLFRSPRLRKWTLIIYLHWFTDSLVYYALSLNSGSLSGNIFINSFLLGVVEIPANILGALALQWRPLGRRRTVSFALFLAGGASVASIPLVATGAVPALSTALAMLGKAGATMGFTGIYIYSAEIFPTEVRNIGIGSSSVCARVSGMAAPYIGGPLGKVWRPLPFLIYGIFGVISGALSLYLPETLGKELPQTMSDTEKLSQSDNINVETVSLNVDVIPGSKDWKELSPGTDFNSYEPETEPAFRDI